MKYNQHLRLNGFSYKLSHLHDVHFLQMLIDVYSNGIINISNAINYGITGL